MVRVISQGFSTPRSRHSSGEEMIDRFAAMKALSALNDDDNKQSSKAECASKTLMLECNTDTNDSFSGADSDSDNGAFLKAKDLQNNNVQCQDHATLKKERRRERNKISAQSYRQRRRLQYSAAQKTLESLESHHKVLLEKVRHLEAEKHIVEEYLKNCVRVPPHHQGTPLPSPNQNCTNPNMTPNGNPCCPEVPSVSSSNCFTASGSQSMPDNFRHHYEEYQPLNLASPLSIIVEKENNQDDDNNNMPLCMASTSQAAAAGSSNS
ncbi:hypothetical protein ACF0H5_003198 [Mactra antiquata]